MKYFTPQLFIKLQDCTDAAAFRTVNAEWERAVQEYESQLQEIAPLLTDGPQRFTRLGSLHDAHVLNIWHAQTRLTIVLQKESEVSKFLILTYSLVDAPCIDPSALPEQYRSTPVTWLYDEIDAERDTTFDATARIQLKSGFQPSPTAGQQRRAPVFTHDILLSNGWELRLRFHQLSIARPSALLPAVPTTTAQPETSLPRSA